MEECGASAQRRFSTGASTTARGCTGGGPSAPLLCDGRGVPGLKCAMATHVLCCQRGVSEAEPRNEVWHKMALTSVSCTRRLLCTARGAPAHSRRPET